MYPQEALFTVLENPSNNKWHSRFYSNCLLNASSLLLLLCCFNFRNTMFLFVAANSQVGVTSESNWIISCFYSKHFLQWMLQIWRSLRNFTVLNCSFKILVFKLQVWSQLNLNICIQILIGKDLDWHCHQTGQQQHPPERWKLRIPSLWQLKILLWSQRRMSNVLNNFIPFKTPSNRACLWSSSYFFSIFWIKYMSHFDLYYAFFLNPTWHGEAPP